MTTEAAEMQGYLQHAIVDRSDRGRANAVHAVARELGITDRRVLAILRGEARRVWADELTNARRWYRSHVERQARLLEQQAAVHRALLDEWDRS